MCSGTASVGSATSPSGNSGNSLTTSSATDGQSRPGGAAAPSSPCGQQEVVEQRRGQVRLQQVGVDSLQHQIAVEGVLAPQHRDVVGIGRCLQRAVEPPE